MERLVSAASHAVVLILALKAVIASASRAIDRAVVGADLLVRAAEACDVPAAWRLVSAASFTPEWLTTTGSSRQTPLMAAVASGCAELAALIMVHPDFDDTSISTRKQRRALSHIAEKAGTVSRSLRLDALHNVQGILAGKHPEARTAGAWHLPEPGEWMPPAKLDELGIPRPRAPLWNPSHVAIARDATHMYSNLLGSRASIEDVDMLWNLLVTCVQTPVGSPHHQTALRHIRSIGWHLFFSGGREAMVAHSMFIGDIARRNLVIPAFDAPVHAHLRAEGMDVVKEYRRMPVKLSKVWNGTGAFVFDDSAFNDTIELVDRFAETATLTKARMVSGNVVTEEEISSSAPREGQAAMRSAKSRVATAGMTVGCDEDRSLPDAAHASEGASSDPTLRVPSAPSASRANDIIGSSDVEGVVPGGRVAVVVPCLESVPVTAEEVKPGLAAAGAAVSSGAARAKEVLKRPAAEMQGAASIAAAASTVAATMHSPEAATAGERFVAADGPASEKARRAEPARNLAKAGVIGTASPAAAAAVVACWRVVGAV